MSRTDCGDDPTCGRSWVHCYLSVFTPGCTAGCVRCTAGESSSSRYYLSCVGRLDDSGHDPVTVVRLSQCPSSCSFPCCVCPPCEVRWKSYFSLAWRWTLPGSVWFSSASLHWLLYLELSSLVDTQSHMDLIISKYTQRLVWKFLVGLSFYYILLRRTEGNSNGHLCLTGKLWFVESNFVKFHLLLRTLQHGFYRNFKALAEKVEQKRVWIRWEKFSARLGDFIASASCRERELYKLCLAARLGGWGCKSILLRK